MGKKIKHKIKQHKNEKINYKYNKEFGKYALILLLITALTFIHSLSNGFVDWDDFEYIANNAYLRDLSFNGIIKIFSESYFSNYHPFTTLTYAIEYQLSGLNPKVFHFTNYLLHLINTFLVFELFRHISKKPEIPFISALIFAVHPMHVESVAWISERKDLLYTLFYITSLIFWIKYIKSDFQKKKYYLLSFLLFLFSLMSKAAAVVLPLILLLFNYFLIKKITYKDILKIAPFLLLSLVFGIITLLLQQKAISNLNITFSLFNRILLVVYSVYFYLIKFFVPCNFSTLHIYPKIENDILPLIYYIAPIVILIVIISIFFIKKDLKHIVIFGILFFIINLILVLQIIPVGNAIVAERYTYVPYIGLSYIISEIYIRLYELKYKKIIVAIGIIFVSFLIVTTFHQNKVWRDDISLWTKAIESNPDNIIAYNKRGVAKAGIKDFSGAIIDFNKAISVDADFGDSYYNKGNAYREKGNYAKAINYYDKAIELKTSYYEAYNNRGLAKAAVGEVNGAFEDYDFAIKFKPNFAEAYNNKGLLKVKIEDFAGAIADYDKAIMLNPNYAQAYHNRGLPKYQLGNIDGAIDDCSKAIKLNPNYAESYNNRAYLKLLKGDKNGACKDWHKASQLGLSEAKQLINQYCN